MATVLEALQNAQVNFSTARHMPALYPLADEQLKNGIGLLEKGYSIDDDVEELIGQYGSLDEVPEAHYPTIDTE